MMLGDSESHAADSGGAAPPERDPSDGIGDNAGLMRLPGREAPGGGVLSARRVGAGRPAAGPAQAKGPSVFGGDRAPECLLWSPT